MIKTILGFLTLFLMACPEKKDKNKHEEEISYDHSVDCNNDVNEMKHAMQYDNNLYIRDFLDDTRTTEILEDDYGIYILPSTFNKCNDFDLELSRSIEQKFGKEFINKIKLKGDSINNHLKLLCNTDLPSLYTKDGIYKYWEIEPTYPGSQFELNKVLDLDNAKCPKKNAKDTFVIAYKLWLNTNGSIIRKKQLLKGPSYWDSIVNNRLRLLLNFTPAYVKDSNDTYKKIPSIIHLEFKRGSKKVNFNEVQIDHEK
jgi:hypothetical protein